MSRAFSTRNWLLARNGSKKILLKSRLIQTTLSLGLGSLILAIRYWVIQVGTGYKLLGTSIRYWVVLVGTGWYKWVLGTSHWVQALGTGW